MNARRWSPLLLALAACGKNRFAPPPPPQVEVAAPVRRDVTTYVEFSGHTEASRTVEVRARVQGVLESMHFEPGGEVAQGDLLFEIEPELYQARVAQAQADLESSQAQLAAAQSQLEIAQAIYQGNAGSKTELVQKQQARDQAKAAVEQAKAALQTAQLDLSYTEIRAPVGGRIDRNLVDVGNLVGVAGPTLLTTIVHDDPMYAYFDASERELLEYRHLNRLGETAAPPGEHGKAFLALPTEDGFPHEGDVDFSSNRVDPSTGTIEVRAVFPNPDHLLLPGLFVRVRLPYTQGAALLVPDEVVQFDQGGRYVLTVDDQGEVHQKRVEIGALTDGERIVQSGLSTDDRVVVEGLQKARPGAKVVARPAGAPGGNAGAAVGAAPAGDEKTSR